MGHSQTSSTDMRRGHRIWCLASRRRLRLSPPRRTQLRSARRFVLAPSLCGLPHTKASLYPPRRGSRAPLSNRCERCRRPHSAVVRGKLSTHVASCMLARVRMNKDPACSAGSGKLVAAVALQQWTFHFWPWTTLPLGPRHSCRQQPLLPCHHPRLPCHRHLLPGPCPLHQLLGQHRRMRVSHARRPDARNATKPLDLQHSIRTRAMVNCIVSNAGKHTTPKIPPRRRGFGHEHSAEAQGSSGPAGSSRQ